MFAGVFALVFGCLLSCLDVFAWVFGGLPGCLDVCLTRCLGVYLSV